MVKFTDAKDVLLEISQNTVAFPLIQVLGSPQNSQISGFQMPGDTPSTINFKVSAPTSLDTVPNAKIRIYTMTLSPNTNALVEYTIETKATSTDGLVDSAFFTEAVSSFSVDNATESLQIQDIPLLVAPTLTTGQFVTGQITRNTGSSGDTAGNILIMKIQLIVNVDVT